MRRQTFLAVVAATCALAALGCGDDSDAAAPVTSVTTAPVPPTTGVTTTTGATSTTTGATAPPVTEPTGDTGDSRDTGKSELEDGRHFGYWSTFDIGDTIAYGEFDLAYFLTGAEAEAAAAARGDEVMNDYYVVNENPKLRTLIAEGDTKVLVLVNQGGPQQTSTNVADFAVDRHEGSGFWVTIDDGIVTEIEEQFVP